MTRTLLKIFYEKAITAIIFRLKNKDVGYWDK